MMAATPMPDLLVVCVGSQSVLAQRAKTAALLSLSCGAAVL